MCMHNHEISADSPAPTSRTTCVRNSMKNWPRVPKYKVRGIYELIARLFMQTAQQAWRVYGSTGQEVDFTAKAHCVEVSVDDALEHKLDDRGSPAETKDAAVMGILPQNRLYSESLLEC